jgi:histone demethylase
VISQDFFLTDFRATKAFQQLLYLDPAFSRANEVHIRLGFMRKIDGDIVESLKHFRRALNDTSPCTLSHLEIKFHIAHLYEIHDKPKLAKQQYELILKEKDLPGNVKADVLRQLGKLR